MYGNGRNMYRYKVNVTRVVDGDTVDVDIDLGFGMVYKKQRVRMKGIDTPESRTRDLEEKYFGKLSKAFLKKSLEEADSIELLSHDKGKFGRILGTLYAIHNEGHPQYEVSIDVNNLMIEENYAVLYDGQSKEDIKNNHLKNRKVLNERGYIYEK